MKSTRIIMKKLMSRDTCDNILLALLSVVSIYYFVDLTVFAIEGNLFGRLSDFGFYHTGTSNFANNPIDLYFRSDTGEKFQGWTYPPIGVLFFLPLIEYNWIVGSAYFLVFIIFNAGLAAYLTVLLIEQNVKVYNLKSKIITILLIVSTGPAYHNYLSFQVNFIVLNCCLAYILFSNAKWFKSAGVILAFGIWLKIYPILLLGLGILYKKYRPSFYWTLAFIVILPIIFSPIIPLELYSYYIIEILPELGSTGSTSIQNQSMLASVARQIMPIDGLRFDEFEVTFELRVLSLIVAVSFCIAALIQRIRNGENVDNSLPLAVCAMTVMISAMSWSYSWVLAMPFLCYMYFYSQYPFILLLCCMAYFLPGYSVLENIIPYQSILGSVIYSRYSIAMTFLITLYFAMSLKTQSSEK